MNKFLRLSPLTKFPKNRQFHDIKNAMEIEDSVIFEDIFPNTTMKEIKALWKKPPQCVYAGFDPTAESLHVGNLLILTNLLRWQRSGHQVIALMGGATGLIGDPSFRKSERVEIERFVIEENLKSIQRDVENIFNNHKQYIWKGHQKLLPIKIVNNIQWYSDLNVIAFIREVGKYFRMGTMLGRSSVESRLQSESGMSFTEFTYQVLQAYDWLHLQRQYNCIFQVGGYDQMGNIMSGYDLITKYAKKKVYGLTLPLVTAEGGRKFGKSTGNVVWLSPRKSSSFQLYQFFIRSKDSDVENYLKFFTFLPSNDIKEIVEDHMKAPEQRKAQKVLAEEVTILVHGYEGLLAARKASNVLYDNSVENLSKLNLQELVEILEGATVVDLVGEPGMSIYELAMKASCFKTDHDARRIIAAGGFYVNHQRITNTEEVVTPGIHILSNNLTLIRTGKKTYRIVRWL